MNTRRPKTITEIIRRLRERWPKLWVSFKRSGWWQILTVRPRGKFEKLVIPFIQGDDDEIYGPCVEEAVDRINRRLENMK